MSKTVHIVLKLAAAGATIAAVAFAVLALGPSGEVTPTEADVLDFDFFATTPSSRFVAALDQLGHEPPRVYRMGEETVYFSARSTNRRPDQLVAEYQRAFVNQGVNARTHLKSVSMFSKEASVMLHGDVIPFEVSEHGMTMGGGVLRGLPDSPQELDAVIEERRGKSFAGTFRGFRNIEARRVDGGSIVTAVWSDDDFDIREASRPGPPDVEIPACPGCRVLAPFETVANDVDRTIHHLESPEPVEAVHFFYRHALSRRGWTRSVSSRQAGSELREYVRDGDRLVVGVQPTERGSTVTVLRGD